MERDLYKGLTLLSEELAAASLGALMVSSEG